ncbi:MAG TPA: amino acid adenylation domain-containing protein, partial [Candidatus Angelobacter sp.]
MSARLDRQSFPGRTLLALLQERSQQGPSTNAYTWLADGDRESSSLSYSDLDLRARAIAAHLQSLKLRRKRAVLLYGPGLEFAEALFACFYAGLVAVPAYVPGSARDYPRIERILQDADCGITLTSAATLDAVSQVVSQCAPESLCLATDTVNRDLYPDWVDPETQESDLAYLQYTSGSTSTPKGVMITHANVLANMASIAAHGGFSDSSVSVSWLPHFHDMGLIYGFLQPIYSGFPAVLLSPAAFIHRPLRWLRAISRYRGTHCGGPNFAYDLCVERIDDQEKSALDLSTWQVAFNGSEPVRNETLERFAAHFASCGFQRKAFYPVYGLAEASLKVTSGGPGDGARVCDLDAGRLAQGEVVPAALEAGHRHIVSCGKASLDHQILIADPRTRTPRVAGQIGEIWVAGPSVAAGYWRNSEATRKTFKAFLPTGQGPYLRTGDLGFVSNGELFITGRLKDCIIIRGRNHYPQDLERTAEDAHPALRKHGSAAFSLERHGQERLVIVSELNRKNRGNANEAMDAVRAAIARVHDIQAFAVVFIKSGALPRTSSGKVQRHACKRKWLESALPVVSESVLDIAAFHDSQPEVTWKSLLGRSDDERRHMVEDYVRGQVARALRCAIGELGDAHSLISLGADSLAGFDLMQRIERDLKVAVPVGGLLDRNIREIAGMVLARIGCEVGSQHDAGAFKKIDRPSRVPLSASQSQVWFLQQLFPESCAYNEHLLMRLDGALETEALERAAAEMVRRHEILRTRFPMSEGHPHQVVLPFDLEELPLLQTADLEGEGAVGDRMRALVVRETQRPFQLETDRPMRLTLRRVSEQEHLLLLVAHHIVCDGASLRVVIQELGALYQAYVRGRQSPLPELALQYADYAVWQQQWLQGAVVEQELEYWRKQLEDLAPLDLPTDRPRPALMSHRGASVPFKLSSELAEQLKELCQREGVTLFMGLMAAFQVMLSKYADQQDVTVGTPVANRNMETKDLIGFFVNMLVLRGTLTGNPTCREVFGRVRQVALDAYQHQQVPFEKLVEELQPQRDLGRSPLFQVTLAVQPALEGDLEFGGLRFAFPEVDAGIAKFDLNLRVIETSPCVRGYLEYSQSIFDSATVQRMAGHFHRLVEQMVDAPGLAIGDLSLLTETEKQQVLLDWNHTAQSYPKKCIDDLFEEQAAKTPEAVAVVYEEQSLSYGELNRRANQLAHYLQKNGVGPEVRVAVCMERSPEMVVAFLAVLKAGGAYVPLDSGHPQERLQFMAEDVQASAVLGCSELLQDWPHVNARMICLDDEREQIAEENDANPETGAGFENLAYVIYTSGSTGRPKGVGVAHRGLANLVDWHLRRYQVDHHDRMTQFATAGFDAAVWEMWPTLAAGAGLHIVHDTLRLDPRRLVNWLAEKRITMTFLPTPVAEAVLKLDWPAETSLRYLLTGGDQLHQVPRQSHEFALVNHYGPTENTVVASVETVPWEIDDTPAIGVPIANTRVYVVDGSLAPVPVGVPGELLIGGDGLAHGYVNQPSLTAERFVPDPFAVTPGARLYRTGDLVRWRSSGQLEFLGRLDHQVKVRGYRIELGEIEAALESHELVEQAVVVVRQDGDGDKRLAAYIVMRPGAGEEVSGELREYVKGRLPEYMVPSAIVQLESLPLTPNGKVDRKGLPEPEVWGSGGQGGESGRAARSVEEEIVRGIFAAVLKKAEVGLEENFFAAGGHSLLAAQVVSRVR